MREGTAEPCKRLRCQIDGENCYVLVGKEFVTIRLPYENRPQNNKLREIVEQLSDTITRGMVMMQEEG